MLFDEAALRKRHFAVYSRILQRAKPKLWKSGRCKGRVRVPGITSLPFTREEFWQHALKLVGEGCIRCPYCVEIGRPANLIDLTNCVWDHVVPIARGGPHTLDNLRPCCQQCNTEKGKFSYEFFVGLVAAIEQWPDPVDRSNALACLRTHGEVIRMRFDHKNSPVPADDSPDPTSGNLALQEDF